MKRVVLDIETNGLISHLVDFSSLPYKLKPTAKLHCIVLRDVDSDNVISLVQEQCTKENLQEALKDCTHLIGHNIIKYDLLMCKLFGVLDYNIGYIEKQSSIYGKEIEIVDTLIWSRLFNPDRVGGHSLDAWGERLGNQKIDFHDFENYSETMLSYCIQDCNVNVSVFKELEKTFNEGCWNKAYNMELKLADIGIKRECYGFKFDVELANKNVEWLDKKLEELTEIVLPNIPPKPLNKGERDKHSPPAKPFKKDGTASANLIKFVAKFNGVLDETTKTYSINGRVFDYVNTEPIVDTLPATMSDGDWIKMHLINLDWRPTEWKQRNLVCNAKKQTMPYEKRVEALERWYEETISGKYTQQRLEILGMPAYAILDTLKEKLKDTKPVYVPTSPCIRVGVAKEICPNLLELGDSVAFAKDFVEYLTYTHRRNSIAGGGFDEDTGEVETGFLSQYRKEDGRIPTPAIEIGASSCRYRHIGVANIPRIGSIYGEEMRSMFCSGEDGYELGYDFSSLENRIQGHYIMKYEGESLAKSLIAEKPYDSHSLNAKKLGISRNDAKSITYALLYGAGAPKIAKMLNIGKQQSVQLVDSFWEAVLPLKQLRDAVEKYWESKGKTHIIGIDGRKIVTRAKHALLNSLFQSGGVIAAKYTTVKMMENFENNGWCVDPFEGVPDVTSMIEYHKLIVALHSNVY